MFKNSNTEKNKMKQNKPGFTVIELVFIIVIIAILAAVLVPSALRAKSLHANSTQPATAPKPSTSLTAEQIEQITQIVKHEISFIKPNTTPQIDDYDVENPVDVPKQKYNAVILNNIDGVWYYRSSGDNALKKLDSNRKLFVFEDGKLIRSE